VISEHLLCECLLFGVSFLKTNFRRSDAASVAITANRLILSEFPKIENPTEATKPDQALDIVRSSRRVTTGHNGDDGRGHFAGFWPRHQRIGTR
jgi:hypothetical protein